MKKATLSPKAGPVAAEVFRRMEEKGMTQKGLAVRAGLNATYVRDMYKGRSNNQMQEHLSKLAAALDCTIEDLTAPWRKRLLADDPRNSGREPEGGGGLDHPDHPLLGEITPSEITLILFWRKLSQLGKETLLARVAQAAPKSPRRKINHG